MQNNKKISVNVLVGYASTEGEEGGRIGIGIEIGVMVGNSSNDTRF